jgi:pyridoxamine 5'-phosphate oxidase
VDHQATGLRNHNQNDSNPFDMFNNWLKLASEKEPNDPSAMALASVDATGLPNVRMVLMRRHDERGFCFFTNFESTKGEELLSMQKAAAVFHWKSIRRQVRIRGPVEPVSPAEADEYFNSRPRGSQIASSASKQSRPLPERVELEQRIAELEAEYEGKPVPRPEHWSGFRIMPLSIEFWDDGEFRTHDRLLFRRRTLESAWEQVWLYP